MQRKNILKDGDWITFFNNIIKEHFIQLSTHKIFILNISAKHKLNFLICLSAQTNKAKLIFLRYRLESTWLIWDEDHRQKKPEMNI